jgi:electron transfer flavoprotein beta subunit
MNIIVCIKQVPNTNEVKIDPKKGTLIREGVPSIINPEDKHGLEEAIRLKEKVGGRVTVLTMGPPQAKVALKEALAMGADEAILVSDRAFAGSDTLATSYVLSKAIEKIGDFDIIFCGRQAIDGDTAQVGPQIAENLEISQVTYATKFELNDDLIEIRRALEDGYSVVETKLPVLVTVLDKINKHRYPSIKGVVNSFSKSEIKVLSAADLSLDEVRLGLDGSPTKVKKTFVPTHEKMGEILDGTPEEKVSKLINILKDVKIV